MTKVDTATTPASPTDPSSVDPNNAAAWETAMQQAKDAGILWKRPESDKRSAQEIIDSSPLLHDLGNQSGVRDALEQRVNGDIDNDADAAFRAEQVLEHVEKFDPDGNRIVGGDVGNGSVDGFTKGGDAKNGTEAGRLQDFDKYGFSNLKGELQDVSSAADDPEARDQAEKLGIKWELPEGDKRSAQDIIDDSPTLKNLGNQSQVQDMLKERVGDFTTDANAAYRATQVLEHVERFDADGNRVVGGDVDNGSIDGFTKGGDAKNGTEAGRLQDFGKYGFSNLKGELQDVSSAAGNTEARDQAEKLGIKWELPDGDKRSAQDIIDANPTLKNLGNQSQVQDMLKERVGDYSTDANAAYRAAQVLDRVSLYDDKGNTQSGGDVSNSSIDGFTKGGDAKNGTEAGRLQDFGKYGFSALPGAKNTDDIGSYKDFLKANPAADDTSKTVAKYAAILDENYDLIQGKTGDGDTLKADDLKTYMEKNPQLGDDAKEALNFWSQPGALGKLDTASDPLKLKADGTFNKKDVESWISKQAPKDASSAITFLSGVANGSAVGGVDTSKLNKDIYEHPENHSKEDKAAALQELLGAQQLITDGAAAGMYKDDYSIVSIANRAGTHPDPKEVIKDLNQKIGVLESDPEVTKYLSESSAKQMSTLLDQNKGLKDALQKTYDGDIKTGKALDTLWDAKTKDSKPDPEGALSEFYSSARMFQDTLGIQNPGDIQAAVKGSKHNGELQDYYEKSIVSGDRFKELLKDHPFEEAASAFSADASVFNAALDPAFTEPLDTKLEDNFTGISRDNAFKDSSFDDLKKAFGVNGGDQLDEAKVTSVLEQISKDNPELLLNQDGTTAKPDQILSGFRGAWDTLRQGTKSLAELAPSWLDPSAKAAADKGVLHGVSGLLMGGVTISKGIQSGGNPTDRQIVDITTGSVQTATLLTEGGIKNYKQYLKAAGEGGGKYGKMSEQNFKQLTDNWSRMENAAKGVGGIAGTVAGAYGIFDGVQSIRKGDTVSGGISITSGSLGVLSGLASTVEGGLGTFAPAVLRALPIAGVAGALGLVAAGVGAIAMLLPGLIEEGKQQARADSFGDLLGSTLRKYEIDGVPNGDIYDVPDSAWPGEDSVAD